MSNDIYSYIKENFGIEITDYQFKRDYIKEPLFITKNSKKLERCPQEDLYYLYIILGLSCKEIAEIFNVNKSTIQDWIKRYNIKKDPQQIKKERNEKNKKTYLKKYNIFHISQLNTIKNKKKQTCLKHYGVENFIYTDEYKLKTKQTCLKHYGVDNYFHSNEYKNKKDEIMKKRKKTYLKKYNAPHFSQSEKYKEMLPKIQEKIHLSKIKNGTYNKHISKEEKEILNLLLQKYPLTKYQYKSKEYPFDCDFYIPEIDTYIEYQGYFTHGKKWNKILGPYDPKNSEHISLLNEWIEKSKELNSQGKPKKQYKIAINVWTITDPLKRETAKKNNLNWIEFFTIDDFMNWYNLL